MAIFLLLPAACSPGPPPGSYRVQSFEAADADGSQTVRGALVTPAFFPALNVSPLFGRLFNAEEYQPGSPAVVVLSERFFRQRFGAEPKRIGTVIFLDGRPASIVGVLPGSFRVLPEVDVWLPSLEQPR